MGLFLVSFFTVSSSALLLAMRRLFSDDNNASLVFCSCAMDLSMLSMADLNFSDARR